MNASFIEREFSISPDLFTIQKILSFIGPRRTGKSTMMKQVLHQLIAQGFITPQQILRIDGNEINPLTFSMQETLVTYFTTFPDLTPFIVIDEVHELPDRVRQVFVAYNRGYHMMISGSNAHLLSSEISTKLRGKVYDQRIWGLSRTEYCQFVGFVDDGTTVSQGQRQYHFERYLQRGSFPEVARVQDPSIKQGLIRNYYDVLLYRDLIERYNIDKDLVLKYVMNYLMQGITKSFSVSKCLNILGSQGLSVSKSLLYHYLEYMQNIFFITPLSQRWRQRGATKYYLEDVGYLTRGQNGGTGISLENTILNYLRRRGCQLEYVVSPAGEIDLVIDGTIAINICRHLSPHNLEREIKPLIAWEHGPRVLIVGMREPGLIIPAELEVYAAEEVVGGLHDEVFGI